MKKRIARADRTSIAVLILCLAGPAFSAEGPPVISAAEPGPAVFSGFTEVKLFGGCRIPALVVTNKGTLLAFCPGHGIQLESGRLLLPHNHFRDREGATDDDPAGRHDHVIYSDDHGKTWKLGGIVPGTYTGENREDLTLRISYDECKTWEKLKVLRPGRDASYSDMAVLPDMSIGLLYETNATGWQSIWFARFTLDCSSASVLPTNIVSAASAQITPVRARMV